VLPTVPRRGFVAGLIQAAFPIRFAAVSLVSTIMTSITSKARYYGWGWRVPFLIGCALAPLSCSITGRSPNPPPAARKREERRAVEGFTLRQVTSNGFPIASIVLIFASVGGRLPGQLICRGSALAVDSTVVLVGGPAALFRGRSARAEHGSHFGSRLEDCGNGDGRGGHLRG
jgi:hypothetical protein